MSTNWNEALKRIKTAETEGGTELDLFGMGLTKLPEEIGRLTNLQSLNLADNKLETLPEWLAQLTNLQSLNLNWNNLGTQADWLAQLTNLQSLDIGSNNLRTLPEWLTQLTNLHSLNLFNNKLEILPEGLAHLTNLQSLSLADNKLETLPEWLAQLTNLHSLNLFHNRLETLPKGLAKLATLQSLNLNLNNLGSLPEWMAQLTNLQSLDIGGNNLGILPEWLVQLTNLQSLDISWNYLDALPEGLAHLTNLQSLDIGGNKLDALPESMAQLTNLQSLDISWNYLDALPEGLAQLTNLQSLDISRNSLEALPEWLAQLPHLRRLYISDNPITEPSPEVLGVALARYQSANLEAIRRYYTQLREEGQETIYEAKLLIVGEGGVGKSSLALKLEDEQAPLRPDQKSTPGIDVIKWQFPLPAPDHNSQPQTQYHVNIWDFGGQAIYFATHQFFLTKRSVYILVADTRQAHTDFYEWLRMQEAFGGDSPILLLKNRNRDKGSRFYIENLPEIQKRFPNLKEIFELDLNHVPAEKDWPWLLEKLKTYFLNLEHVGKPRPKTWVRVRQALAQDGRNTLSRTQFLQLSYDQGVKREEDALQLSDYLHHLGDILHFQEDDILTDIVILKPTWGLDAVYRVLDNQTIIDNWGTFTRRSLRALWHEDHYTGHHHELLRLMQNFQLCYPLPGHQDTFIAPQLLKPDVPPYDWDETENLQLRYRYPVFFPRGILSRAIVKLNQKIKDQRLVWRSGVILQNEYAEAELLELRAQNEIRLRISGRLKRELLTEIVQALDDLHRGFPKLVYQKLVPCKCSSCQQHPEPHFFDLDQLRERLSRGKQEIECQLPDYEMVPISSLLDDGIINGRPEMSKAEVIQYFITGDYVNRDKAGRDIIGGDKAGGDITKAINPKPSN